MRTLSIAFVIAILSAPIVAHAEDPCEGWFCDEPSKLNGQPVAVELKDGTVIRGVIVELAADHVTLAIGDAKVTLVWAQVATFRVDPAVTKTVPADPAPEEVVVESPPPAAKATPLVIVKEAIPKEVDEAPPPPPPNEEGPFTVGARLKLMAAFGGTRFHQNSQTLADYAPGGAGFELSFAVRLNSILFLRTSYEHAELVQGERNFNMTSSPTSDAVGIGLRAVYGNAPDVRGIFEIGVGYRWLHVPYANGAAPDNLARRPGNGWATFEGTESLRTALGTAFLVDRHGRFELLLEGALGRFSHIQDDNLEKRAYVLPQSSQSHHVFVGISLGLELGP